MQKYSIDEIQEKIIDYVLTHQRCNPKDLKKSLRIRSNRIIEAKKLLVKQGRLKEEKDMEDYRKSILTLVVPQSDFPLQGIMSSLPLAEQRINKNIRKLQKLKPLFIPSIITDGKKNPLSLKPKNKKILDDILTILNDLVVRSVAITYAQCLGNIPKIHRAKIELFHKNCITTIQKTMEKLEKQHPESQMELNSYLYYNILGYRDLTSLERASKYYK